MRHRLPTALCASLLIGIAGACADDPVPAPSPPRTDETTSNAGTPDDNGSSARFDPDGVRLGVETVAEGYEQPLGLVPAGDGSNRLYVVEQVGRIRSFRGSAGPDDFLDITDRVRSGGEQGLLGLAFHPRYESNGRFFVNYTGLDGDTVIAEYRSDGDVADPSSERVLLGIDQPFANHNGGQLTFGPDGFLYITTGDGGSAGDPNNNGQRLDTLLGKVLRIDVNERSAAPYGIPSDNPFADDGDARAEIWAFGLRNPWRVSFDRDTGDLWIADVGQNAIEEVNREPAASEGGRNYGWRILEGDACFIESDCDRSGMVAPVMTYTHDFGCSITGGYVYRGEAHEALRGAYVTGDFCSGNIWAVPAGIEDLSDPQPALETDLSISSFGEDGAGELYLTDHAGGRVLRVTAEPVD